MVLDHRVGVRHQHAGVVDRRDADVERRGAAGVGGVGDLRHRAVPILERREGVVAVGRDGDRAHARDGRGLTRRHRGRAHREARHAQRVVHVAVVAQHVARGRVVLDHRVGVRHQHAGVVDRGDADVQV